MQPARAPLPELHRLRHDAYAAPEVRHRNLGTVRPALGQGCIPRVQRGPALPRWKHRRLAAGPGTQLGTPRPRPEVRLGLGAVHPLGTPDDHDLALEVVPGEHQADRWVARQLSALARGVVGEEHQPVRPGTLEQHGARARHRPCAGAADRAQHHGVRLGQPSRHSLVQPPVELLVRVGREVVLGQPSVGVGPSEIGQLDGVHPTVVAPARPARGGQVRLSPRPAPGPTRHKR